MIEPKQPGNVIKPSDIHGGIRVTMVTMKLRKTPASRIYHSLHVKQRLSIHLHGVLTPTYTPSFTCMINQR